MDFFVNLKLELLTSIPVLNKNVTKKSAGESLKQKIVKHQCYP